VRTKPAREQEAWREDMGRGSSCFSFVEFSL